MLGASLSDDDWQKRDPTWIAFIFCLPGHCIFSSPQTGTVFLAPHAGSRLALIISGSSIEGIRDAVHLATPTIPPMTRSPFSNMVPDYVITGPLFRARGPGGYLCTGFWDNRWGYGREISSCVCWVELQCVWGSRRKRLKEACLARLRITLVQEMTKSLCFSYQGDKWNKRIKLTDRQHSF